MYRQSIHSKTTWRERDKGRWTSSWTSNWSSSPMAARPVTGDTGDELPCEESSAVNKTRFLRPRPRPEQQEQDQDQSLKDRDQDQDQSDKTKTCSQLSLPHGTNKKIKM